MKLPFFIGVILTGVAAGHCASGVIIFWHVNPLAGSIYTLGLAVCGLSLKFDYYITKSVQVN